MNNKIISHLPVKHDDEHYIISASECLRYILLRVLRHEQQAEFLKAIKEWAVTESEAERSDPQEVAVVMEDRVGVWEVYSFQQLMEARGFDDEVMWGFYRIPVEKLRNFSEKNGKWICSDNEYFNKRMEVSYLISEALKGNFMGDKTSAASSQRKSRFN